MTLFLRGVGTARPKFMAGRRWPSQCIVIGGSFVSLAERLRSDCDFQNTTNVNPAVRITTAHEGMRHQVKSKRAKAASAKSLAPCTALIHTGSYSAASRIPTTAAL